MNKFVKPIALMGLAGALTVGALASQAEARDGRWAAAGVGFAAGALIGSAAANASYYNGGYYGPGYAYEPGYAYDSYAYAPGYSYAPGYAYDSYAYAPGYRDQTYYSSYRNRHSYGWNTGVNRPSDSYTMNKRHLEGTE